MSNGLDAVKMRFVRDPSEAEAERWGKQQKFHPRTLRECFLKQFAVVDGARRKAADRRTVQSQLNDDKASIIDDNASLIDDMLALYLSLSERMPWLGLPACRDAPVESVLTLCCYCAQCFGGAWGTAGGSAPDNTPAREGNQAGAGRQGPGLGNATSRVFQRCYIQALFINSINKYHRLVARAQSFTC